MNIFIISDTHFDHKNIIKYCKRPFDNVHHMNECLIENWNSVVKENDTVIHIGDFAFCKTPEFFLDRLNGKKTLILGNHDKPKLYRNIKNLEVLPYKTFHINGIDILFNHYPIYNHFGFTYDVRYDYCFHGHVHNNNIHSKLHYVSIDEVPKSYLKSLDIEWSEDKKYVMLPANPRNINFSVEVINYTPVNLEDVCLN